MDVRIKQQRTHARLEPAAQHRTQQSGNGWAALQLSAAQPLLAQHISATSCSTQKLTLHFKRVLQIARLLQIGFGPARICYSDLGLNRVTLLFALLA